MRLITIYLLLIIFAGLTQGQSDESDTAPDLPSPAILPFHTYHAKWLRYFNAQDGEPILAVEGFTEFAYRFVLSGKRMFIDDFADADKLEALLEAAVYDEDAIAGSCQTDRLPGDLPDVFCVPGTRDMPYGQVVLALYHPETMEIVALTTSIDNKAGGATKADWSAMLLPTSEPEAAGCGGYKAGEWIKAKDFVNSAGLPVIGQAGDTSDYQCVVPQDGSPYFQAYSLGAQPSGGQSGGGNGGGSGSGGDNGGSNDPGGLLPIN